MEHKPIVQNQSYTTERDTIVCLQNFILKIEGKWEKKYNPAILKTETDWPGWWDRENYFILGQNFFISWFTGFFFRSRVGGTKKINKKALKMTSWTGHFQSFFFLELFFLELFFKISPEKTVKLVK